jgi:WD40 repeat protein
MEGTGERIECMAQSSDGVLLAWGTELGYIFIVNTDTGDQLALWKAHFSQVEGLCFSPSNTTLTSCGIDLKPTGTTDDYKQLSPEAQEKMPRSSSVIMWDLERWIMLRMKSR